MSGQSRQVNVSCLGHSRKGKVLLTAQNHLVKCLKTFNTAEMFTPYCFRRLFLRCSQVMACLVIFSIKLKKFCPYLSIMGTITQMAYLEII